LEPGYSLLLTYGHETDQASEPARGPEKVEGMYGVYGDTEAPWCGRIMIWVQKVEVIRLESELAWVVVS